MMGATMSDYHRRFTEHAKKYLDGRTFAAIHAHARNSAGGAAPRTPKVENQQPVVEAGEHHIEHVEMEAVANKEPVTKSALEALRGMWETTVDAVLGRERVNKSGLTDNLNSYFVPGLPPKNALKDKRPKKKRVTKSALDSFAAAVAEHDGIEPDGMVAIQLGAEFGRTKGAIGFASEALDKATIAYDLAHGVIPLPDASVNQFYVTKSAVDAGLDLDALMPELRRVSAPGARLYTDMTRERVTKGVECAEAKAPAPNASATAAIARAKKHAPKAPTENLTEKVAGFTKNRKQLVLKSVGEQKTIAGVDPMRQLVYAPALVPNEISVKGQVITCEDIEYSAHRYLREGRLVGSEHGRPIDAHVVESFIAPQDLHFDGEGTPYGAQDIPKGSWVVGIKVNDPAEWAKVMSGEYTGFSTGGDAYVRDLEYKPGS